MSGRRKNKGIPAVPNTISNSALSGAGRHINEALKADTSCSFSFKYLNLQDETFTVKDGDSAYYYKVIERLRDLSATPVSALLANRSSTLRCHPIDWSNPKVIRDRFGIPNEDELYDTPYQIAVSSNKHGRMHGFFTGDIFNIVWLDRNHSLYPDS